MKKTAILLMMITVMSKVLGFVRDITLSYFYGASNISDAYLISQTIPGVIFSFVAMAISTGYIPMYSNIEREFGEKEGVRYTNNLINILLVISTVIISFSLIFAGSIVKIFASGFEGDTLILAIKLTRISIIGIYFTCLISVFSGFLQIKGNYFIPALVGFPFNFFVVLSIILSYEIDLILLAIGSVVATASQFILLMPFVARKGYRYDRTFDIKDEHIKIMGYLAIPVIIGVSVDGINMLVDRTLASRISIGSVSALNYASKLNGFVLGLFVTPLVTVIYPIISKMAAEENLDEFKKSIIEAINLISILVMPATVGAMIFARPVVEFLFRRGAFDIQAAEMTSGALFFYSIGMIGYGLQSVLSRGFYSMKDTKTPMINAAIAMTMNIILNLLFSKYMGISGLALATSISAIFCTALLFISLRRKIGPFGMKNTIISFIKILIASLAMGGIAKFSYNILLDNLSANLTLILSIAIGAFTYFTLIYFMKIDEVDTMVNLVRSKLKEK